MDHEKTHGKGPQQGELDKDSLQEIIELDLLGLPDINAMEKLKHYVESENIKEEQIQTTKILQRKNLKHPTRQMLVVHFAVMYCKQRKERTKNPAYGRQRISQPMRIVGGGLRRSRVSSYPYPQQVS